MALQAVVEGRDISSLAFVNAHGTASMFNDQMESVAISRAGLSAVPVNGLKGYYGHTLGAAGVLETIISMYAVEDHTILGTRGFSELGVSGDIRLSAQHQHTDQHKSECRPHIIISHFSTFFLQNIPAMPSTSDCAILAAKTVRTPPMRTPPSFTSASDI